MRRNAIKTIIVLMLIFFLCPSFCFSGSSSHNLVSDYLFEVALKYYKQGNTKDALAEFKKILILQPDNEKAIDYVRMIEKDNLVLSPEFQRTIKIKKELSVKTITAGIESESKPSSSSQSEKVLLIQAEVPKKNEIVIVEDKGIETLSLNEKKESSFGILSQETQFQQEISSNDEELPLQIISQPVKNPGEIRIFIDGDEVSLQRPLTMRQGEIFIPLRDISRLFSFSFFDLGAQNFRLVSPQGKRQEVNISNYIDGEPVITQEELKDYFVAESQFDDLEKALYISTGSPSQFKTYIVKQPKKALLPEDVPESTLEEKDNSQEKPFYIPESVRPDAELNASAAYSYINYHTTPPYKSLITSISGRISDFKVSGSREQKENNGKFDHSSTWLNLEKPGLAVGLFDQSINMYPLRGQYQSFTGLKVIGGAKDKTTFIGGDIENTVSGTEGNVKYLGDIVGLGQEFYPVDWLGIKGLMFYLDNQAEFSRFSRTTSFPRKNLVNFFDATVKLTPLVSFFSQLAHCYYTPDDQPGTDIHDWDWRLGPELKTGRYNLKFAYEFVGDKYVSLGNPASYQNYKGFELNGDYKIFDGWSVSNSFSRYQDNVEKDPAKTTNENQSFSLSSAHQFLKDQSVNFSFNNTISNPSGPNPGVSNKANLYRMDYSTPFYGQHLLLNYQFYNMSSVDHSLEYHSDTIGGTLFKSFGTGSTWSLHQELSDTYYETGTDTSSARTSFSLYYRLTPLLDFNFNPSYDWEKAEGEKCARTVSCSTGLWYKLAPDISLRADYSITNYNLRTEKDRWPRNWSIMTSLIKNFDLSTPMKFGRIKGNVFKDMNGNGRIDSSDQPAEGVKVTLEDGRVAKTNKQGGFEFLYVIPQPQKISLDLGDYLLDWTTRNFEKEISVNSFKTTKVYILLIESSSISGKVFVDENGDSIFQDNEEPLEGITIKLMPDEQIRVTDEEGNFKFDNVPLGRYQLNINLQSIPLGYELVSDKTLKLLVLPDEENTGCNFVVRLKPNTPIQKF